MTPDLTYGGSGDLVLQVTNFLTRLNLLKSESQIFDATVEAAVKEFQQARGLTVTGVVDAITLRSLDEARWKLGFILRYTCNAWGRCGGIAITVK